MHQRLLPLLLVNFVESSPGPVKFAMAAMGLCEEIYRLPMVPIKDGVEGKDAWRAARAGAVRRGARVAGRVPSSAGVRRCPCSAGL